MAGTLETALRNARGIGKLNLFRNKARGGWEAAIAREGTGSTFSVGIDDDPVEAILKALRASEQRSVEPVKPKAIDPTPASTFKGGIFG